jgi:LuxR family maltose regulon positive regulatory protein
MVTISSAIEGPGISLYRAPLARDALVAHLDEAVTPGGVAVLAAEPGTGKTEVLAQWRDAAPPGLPVTVVDGAAPRSWAPGLRAARDHVAGTDAALVVDHAERLPPAYLALLGDAVIGRGRGLGVILAGRRDPGLCVIELRRTAPVVELAGEDLAWSAADVADAFARWGRPLRAGEAEDLAWRTDGWAAAVRLAALLGPRVLEAESGPLHDYVLGPGLAGVPDDLVAAALRLGLADEVDEPIAELLARPPGGAAALLQTLRNRRLFVRPSGEAGAWRLHRLFAQVARRELSARDPLLVGELRRRLRRHLGVGTTGALPPIGPPAAIADAAIEDELLATHAVDLLLEGVLDRPSPAALAALPRATATGRAAAALGLLATGDLAGADAVLRGDAGDGPRDVLAVAALLGHRRRGDRDGLAAAVEAIGLGEAERGTRALAYLELGLLDQDLGDVDACEEHLQLAISLAQSARRPALVARARAALALLSASAGRLRDATRLAEAASAGEVSDDARAPVDARVRACLARAQVALLRDDIAAARAWAARARAAAGDTDDVTLWLDVLFWEVATLDALGDYDDASARLAEARDFSRRAAYPGCTRPRWRSTAAGCSSATAARRRLGGSWTGCRPRAIRSSRSRGRAGICAAPSPTRRWRRSRRGWPTARRASTRCGSGCSCCAPSPWLSSATSRWPTSRWSRRWRSPSPRGCGARSPTRASASARCWPTTRTTARGTPGSSSSCWIASPARGPRPSPSCARR